MRRSVGDVATAKMDCAGLSLTLSDAPPRNKAHSPSPVSFEKNGFNILEEFSHDERLYQDTSFQPAEKQFEAEVFYQGMRGQRAE